MFGEAQKDEEWNCSTFPFLPASNAENGHISSPITTKGFINYVFFRNRAVRNLAGTRLDSLVW